MPIPRPTVEKAKAALERFESLLSTAIANRHNPKEVYWAAEDLMTLFDFSTHDAVKRGASDALARAFQSAADADTKAAIQQAVERREYQPQVGRLAGCTADIEPAKPDRSRDKLN